MKGKIAAVMAKREAESYRAQGLHQEAIELFVRLLDSCPNIDPAIRDGIRAQIDGLSVEKTAATSRREKPLSATEVARIRRGWGDRAGATEILVCANAFLQIGAHREALVEFGQLLRNGGDIKTVIDPIADALVAIHPPVDLPAAVQCFCEENFGHYPKGLAFEVHLAKPMLRHAPHAMIYVKYLLEKKELPPEVQNRLTAALDKLNGATVQTEKNINADISTSSSPRLKEQPSRQTWRKFLNRVLGKKEDRD
jgi:tetratricopeptide (TPR) repeat protein